MLFYRLLFGLGLSLFAPFAFLRQAAGGKAIGDWRGRLGLRSLPRSSRGIWVHGVSVGEVSAARAVLRALSERAPGVPRLLSSSTAAGLDLARRAPEADGSLPFPFDLRRPVERALAALDPCLVLLTETEIWPLFLDCCGRRGVPVAVVNGRISDRTYRRYRLAPRLLRNSLSRISLFAMQSEGDAERLERIGVPPSALHVTGNVKFDVGKPEETEVAKLLRDWADGRRVLLAGSTHAGEEEAVLEAWRRLEPRPLLVVAPRRPERFETVLSLLSSGGIVAIRRTSGGGRPDAVLLDTVGELAGAYASADLAFVGGSLAPIGGHNPIEAWSHGVPTILGPNAHNFRDIVQDGIDAGAAVIVRGREELAEAARRLFLDETARLRCAAAALRLVEQNRGAAARTADLVLALRKIS